MMPHCDVFVWAIVKEQDLSHESISGTLPLSKFRAIAMLCDID